MHKKERKELARKIEALIIAVPRESAAYDYYMELADQFDDPSSKDMFVFLAKQEKMHREKLEELITKLEEKLQKLQDQ
ncbi:MAG: hypothetical protein IEMM0002_0203 [bacterium]|nr:MAG: hypothetical protein IEMM0002_0203 [bacterium]